MPEHVPRPTEMVPEPPKPHLLKTVDHISFPRVVATLIKNDPDLKHCSVSASFPKAEVEDLPRIVHRLVRRTPGMAGKSGVLEPYKPRLRHEYPNEDGSVTQVWSQLMTCLFQFDVCAATAEEADELVYRLDWLLRHSVGVFLQLGAREMTFDEQLQDGLLPDIRPVEVRSIRWQVILEAIESKALPSIQEVRVRTFLPQEEAEEGIVRGASHQEDPQNVHPDIDVLSQTHVNHLYHVHSEPTTPLSFLGEATATGTEDTAQDTYQEGVDFLILYDHRSGQTALQWTQAGRRPAPGATFYLRYSFWTAHSTLYLPG